MKGPCVWYYNDNHKENRGKDPTIFKTFSYMNNEFKDYEAYQAPVANPNWLSLLISSQSNSTLGTLVTEYISTIPAVMLNTMQLQPKSQHMLKQYQEIDKESADQSSWKKTK